MDVVKVIGRIKNFVCIIRIGCETHTFLTPVSSKEALNSCAANTAHSV